MGRTQPLCATFLFVKFFISFTDIFRDVIRWHKCVLNISIGFQTVCTQFAILTIVDC